LMELTFVRAVNLISQFQVVYNNSSNKRKTTNSSNRGTAILDDVAVESFNVYFGSYHHNHCVGAK